MNSCDRQGLKGAGHSSRKDKGKARLVLSQRANSKNANAAEAADATTIKRDGSSKEEKSRQGAE